ncbi:MAG: hypothetical protein IJ849_01835 [Selenomonadaceae bacterium]|nr:hypothetical protein [Selenomonadaceae bacterium]
MQNLLAATKTTTTAYSYTPVTDVTVAAHILGNLAAEPSSHAVTYQVTANQADKLTFGNVAWRDTGALLTRPNNITFAGADVDTANINFTNIQSLAAGKQMTLVADFGNSVGQITGDTYKVGSTLEGKGKAALAGSDLIFTVATGTETDNGNGNNGGSSSNDSNSDGNNGSNNGSNGNNNSDNNSGGNSGGSELTIQEQTHNTLMGAEVSMAALSAGNDFIGAATEGLAMAANTGADGSMHYTGGGLLAKWTAKSGLYAEGSFRAGTVNDDAHSVLRDVNGSTYSYETDAPYTGFHLGVGKEIRFDAIHSLDVYGKYFFNRRQGVSFDAGGHYDLDAVTSQVLRVGACYTVKRDKWSFYSGLAYEHELDGKATGKADGLPIRGADTGGGSFRGEIGATMRPGENSPWSLDLNLSGFAGKKQGFSGGVSVAFMF